MKKHFISYGDHNYLNSKARISAEAKNFGFDTVAIFEPQDLSEEFIKQTRPFIHESRGGGYWIWKAYILKETLGGIEEGDLLVYADAGCHINIHGKPRFQEYIDLLDTNDTGIISFEMPGLKEEYYTTESVFEYFSIGKDDLLRKSGQFVANTLIMKKCDKLINLIEEFYEIAVSRPDLFSDQYNNLNRSEIFIDHRHDQSIFGLLRKRMGSIVIKDETWAENFDELIHVPILAKRIRG
jgi:hypothetical protein